MGKEMPPISQEEARCWRNLAMAYMNQDGISDDGVFRDDPLARTLAYQGCQDEIRHWIERLEKLGVLATDHNPKD